MSVQPELTDARSSDSAVNDWSDQLTTWVRNACILEVQAAKPGNVSPGCNFSDAGVQDFITSACTIAPVMAQAGHVPVGLTILNAVRQTRHAVGHNTNLGIILLLAPLAAVPSNIRLADGIERVLTGLTVQDAVDTYQAIRIAAPGGLGHVGGQDVADNPTADLRTCMQLAADRDLVAAQYVNCFHDVLCDGINLLCETRHWTSHPESRLGYVAVRLLAQRGDSLIQRKCGPNVSQQARRLASDVLNAGWPFQNGSNELYRSLDRYLRADGHRRNPGTTADLVAAIVFTALRDGLCSTDVSGTQLNFIDR